MMKILHLSGEPEDCGGVLSVIRNLQTASQPMGWTHTVAVQSRYEELRKPALTYWKNELLCSDSPNHITLLSRAVRSFFEVKRYLRDESFDIIHAHNRGTFLTGLAVAVLLKRPVVYTNHSYCRRTGMYWWATRAPNFHTVVLTPNMARHYRVAVRPPRTNIISACCSDHYFLEPLVTRTAPSGPSGLHRLIGVGNIMRWKKWHLIAQALSLLQPADRDRIQFSLWGPTPDDPDSRAYDRELRTLISERGLGNHFLLRGSTLSVSDCLRQADWFVLPSTNEPCSVAMIEALALGLPGLVSASGGNIDIVKNGQTGLLFEPDQPADLARRLQSIANSETAVLPPDQIRESVRPRCASAVTTQYAELFHAVRA